MTNEDLIEKIASCAERNATLRKISLQRKEASVAGWIAAPLIGAGGAGLLSYLKNSGKDKKDKNINQDLITSMLAGGAIGAGGYGMYQAITNPDNFASRMVNAARGNPSTPVINANTGEKLPSPTEAALKPPDPAVSAPSSNVLQNTAIGAGLNVAAQSQFDKARAYRAGGLQPDAAYPTGATKPWYVPKTQISTDVKGLLSVLNNNSGNNFGYESAANWMRSVKPEQITATLKQVNAGLKEYQGGGLLRNLWKQPHNPNYLDTPLTLQGRVPTDAGRFELGSPFTVKGNQITMATKGSPDVAETPARRELAGLLKSPQVLETLPSRIATSQLFGGKNTVTLDIPGKNGKTTQIHVTGDELLDALGYKPPQSASLGMHTGLPDAMKFHAELDAAAHQKLLQDALANPDGDFTLHTRGAPITSQEARATPRELANLVDNLGGRRTTLGQSFTEPKAEHRPAAEITGVINKIKNSKRGRRAAAGGVLGNLLPAILDGFFNPSDE